MPLPALASAAPPSLLLQESSPRRPPVQYATSPLTSCGLDTLGPGPGTWAIMYQVGSLRSANAARHAVHVPALQCPHMRLVTRGVWTVNAGEEQCRHCVHAALSGAHGARGREVRNRPSGVQCGHMRGWWV